MGLRHLQNKRLIWGREWKKFKMRCFKWKKKYSSPTAIAPCLRALPVEKLASPPRDWLPRRQDLPVVPHTLDPQLYSSRNERPEHQWLVLDGNILQVCTVFLQKSFYLSCIYINNLFEFLNRITLRMHGHEKAFMWNLFLELELKQRQVNGSEKNTLKGKE